VSTFVANQDKLSDGMMGKIVGAGQLPEIEKIR
jgi:hypothetical protein